MSILDQVGESLSHHVVSCLYTGFVPSRTMTMVAGHLLNTPKSGVINFVRGLALWKFFLQFDCASGFCHGDLSLDHVYFFTKQTLSAVKVPPTSP